MYGVLTENAGFGNEQKLDQALQAEIDLQNCKLVIRSAEIGLFLTFGFIFQLCENQRPVLKNTNMDSPISRSCSVRERPEGRACAPPYSTDEQFPVGRYEYVHIFGDVSHHDVSAKIRLHFAGNVLPHGLPRAGHRPDKNQAAFTMELRFARADPDRTPAETVSQEWCGLLLQWIPLAWCSHLKQIYASVGCPCPHPLAPAFRTLDLFFVPVVLGRCAGSDVCLDGNSAHVGAGRILLLCMPLTCPPHASSLGEEPLAPSVAGPCPATLREHRLPGHPGARRRASGAQGAEIATTSDE